MALPIRTTLNDVDALCGYLVTKPTGATMAEAKAVLDSKVLDARKINALKFWELIDDSSGKMMVTERGRLVGRDKGARRSEALREVVAAVGPYRAVVERAVHRNELSLSALEVAAHWHQHFKGEASSNDKILNDQAVCFFQIAEGADLGKLVVGRKGQPTRFEFDGSNARALAEGAPSEIKKLVDDPDPVEEDAKSDSDSGGGAELTSHSGGAARGNRVFITHGKNRKILEQVKELVLFGKFEPIVAQERETAAKPVPDKVMDEMRSCHAAVIHVGSEGTLLDSTGKEVPQVNGNVLIEIGAAMALYGRNFILLVEEGVSLPSNLQGLYECRYSGDELNMPATMKLLKAFNEFK
ncbi:nucleotide-binding protein [Sphingomonas canadensis]|uniref:Nucleotide-binding protein n=1 Tax=Sphingomonas canadensis TaxID=1219257 RepID=A0ABW3HAI2_9SPHN|nr:nucleotide-binding protein [Sphingomonas canadensis]MCW3837338.1 nucleotide-binding protein [Sphingomonas canadensis]